MRSDGSIIDSSVIISCDFTEEVNRSTNLAFGDVTSSELTVVIRSTEAIQQGEILTYYMIEDDVEILIGKFIAEKSTVASSTSIKFSAYDNISRTEKSFSGWLRENQTLFPMTLLQLVQYACLYCGVAFRTTDFPHADLPIGAFYADGITCRQILAWASSIACRFVRANVYGEIEFSQYTRNEAYAIASGDGYANADNLIVTDSYGHVVVTSSDMTVTDDGDGNVTATVQNMKVYASDGNVVVAGAIGVPYRQGSLSYETYQTDNIERVQIKQSDNDVGVIYPEDAEGNCYTISGNMLLGTCSSEEIAYVAKTLYEQLSSVTYVPFSVTLPRTLKVRAGEIIRVTDVNGRSFSSLVMKMTVNANGIAVSSTGDKSYGSSVAVATSKYTNLTGKVLEISKSIDGLTIANESLDGRLGSLELNTETFKVAIQDEVDRMSELVMTPEKVEIKISEVVDAIDSVKTSTGYTFDKDGLKIHKDGTQMHNTLDHNGMYVRRGSTAVLTADAEGVNSINLTARQYLIVGKNARFEDYPSKRTACFYVGG